MSNLEPRFLRDLFDGAVLRMSLNPWTKNVYYQENLGYPHFYFPNSGS